MALYAIGDVQGCLDELEALLDHLQFDPIHDKLWFTGDLVNRGPRSADTVRFVIALGEAAITVLGNHDLHLLAVADGARRLRTIDTFVDVLEANDREHILEWLRHRPFIYCDDALGVALIHAGLLPQWDLVAACMHAAEVETVLRGKRYSEFFKHMYGNTPDAWDDSLDGWDRLRVIVNAFTRLRYCDCSGRMDLRPTGPPGSQPTHLMPWFQIPERRIRDLTIVFGHWSSLGVWRDDGVVALDTGCVWGGALTAVRLDSPRRAFYRVPCAQKQVPAR
ncbi:MAG: symmetrical bis(5'-nucleosyl)-tetraphosphatase [Acidiferrobacterales bacterium]